MTEVITKQQMLCSPRWRVSTIVGSLCQGSPQSSQTHTRPIVNISFSSWPNAVVFGKVTEGTGLLKKLDALGSRSGKPAQRVSIANCGELPSKRQIMAKLQVRVLQWEISEHMQWDIWECSVAWLILGSQNMRTGSACVFSALQLSVWLSYATPPRSFSCVAALLKVRGRLSFFSLALQSLLHTELLGNTSRAEDCDLAAELLPKGRASCM